jgi:hypothetical protein
MSKPKTLCVFCGEPGATKGHIWPDWLNYKLPNPADKRINYQGFYRTFQPNPNKTTPFMAKTRQGRGSSQKPRNTCLKCNNEWMSRIEDAAKPIIAKLMKGKHFLLDADDQRKVAALISLVSMRTEFMEMGRISTPDSDREWIRLHESAPPSWKVWIAKFWGLRPADYFFNGSVIQLAPEGTVRNPDDMPRYNTQSSTFVWGQLVAVSVSSTFLTEFEGYDRVLRRIWPIDDQSINTADLIPLMDAAVASLGEALNRTFGK